MDIDVKNAYDKVIKSLSVEERGNFWALVYEFIKYISIKDAEERFDAFCSIYVKQRFDKKFAYKAQLNKPVNGDIVSFLVTLGKYYIFSRYDKKDINKESFTEFIKKVSCNSIPDDSKVQEQECKDLKAEKVSEHLVKETNVDDEEIDSAEPEESLEELLEQLHNLIGLESVKQEVNQIINLIRVKKKADEWGENPIPLSLHLVFYGNPGTGKTTVARLIAKIYKALGVLSKGQLIEVDRSGLVGGYVGQTAIKTQEAIDKAMGGILFIDEAYSLTHGKGEGDFGQEAVDTILKAMEDHRDDFIVIAAGYPDLMKEFISSNPGLKSRFNTYINFEDYNPDELFKIFKFQCDSQNLKLTDECNAFLNQYFIKMYDNRGKDYANGREVRNYFERVIKARANRLSPIIETVTKDEFYTITLSDLENAESMRNQELD